MLAICHLRLLIGVKHELSKDDKYRIKHTQSKLPNLIFSLVYFLTGNAKKKKKIPWE